MIDMHFFPDKLGCIVNIYLFLLLTFQEPTISKPVISNPTQTSVLQGSGVGIAVQYACQWFLWVFRNNLEISQRIPTAMKQAIPQKTVKMFMIGFLWVVVSLLSSSHALYRPNPWFLSLLSMNRSLRRKHHCQCWYGINSLFLANGLYMSPLQWCAVRWFGSYRCSTSIPMSGVCAFDFKFVHRDIQFDRYAFIK